MHSSGFFDHLHVDEDGASVEQVRSLEEVHQAITMAGIPARGFFEEIIKRYRPGELASFHWKYMNEWRCRSMNAPKVAINRRQRPA